MAVAALAAGLPSPALAGEEQRLTALARAAIRAEVSGEKPPVIGDKSPPAAVFVTIERSGRVMGCRGSLRPRSGSLEEEIVLAARAAAAHDPRYRPLAPRDLTEFQVTVTVVGRLDPLNWIETLTPADGLVLKSGNRTGVVLPWEGKDPRVRLEWAFRKAGVRQGSPCQLYRLIAERFRG